MIRASSIPNVPWVGRAPTVCVCSSGSEDASAIVADPPALNWWQWAQLTWR